VAPPLHIVKVPGNRVKDYDAGIGPRLTLSVKVGVEVVCSLLLF